MDDLDQLVAVADFQFRGRVKDDQEFGWLLEDIEEFNASSEDRNVSLLEATRREEMETKKAKREARKNGTGPLVEDFDPLAVVDTVEEDLDEATEDDDASGEDERPDLMLRESARIVADMVRLGADGQLLATQFSQVKRENQGEAVN